MTYRRILVPVDGSPTSNKALVAALELARERDGRVRLLHAIDELALAKGWEDSTFVMNAALAHGRKALDMASDIARAAGIEADTRLVETPGRQLGETVAHEAAAWEADLVVVGTHGRRGVGRLLLGSGAESVIRMSRVPVLVIRGDEPPGS